MKWLEFQDWPAWGLMWALAIGLYACLKALAWVDRPALTAPLWKHAAFLLGWPGMNAGAFLFSPPGDVKAPKPGEWITALGRTAAGVALVVFAGSRATHSPGLLTGWIGMVGLIMALHFGLFHVLSCGWRCLGLGATPIMNRPLMSTGVSEFWSRRWNLAFRDLTSRFLIRPLRRPLGATGAFFAAFAISGLIHDAVISLPAGGGYGWPTAYFLGQAVAMQLERSGLGRRIGLGTGRVFAWCVIAGPAPILFHRPFVERVILPFLRALGALW